MSEATSDPDDTPVPSNSGWGNDALRSTLRFLTAPALLALLTTVLGVQLPGWVLYGIGGFLGLVLLARTRRDPEWLMAVAILYLPLSMLLVVPIGPGLNGTNIILLLLGYSWFRHGRLDDTPKPGAAIVRNYFLVSLLSVITAAVTMGPGFVVDHVLDVKRWVDPFIVYFAFTRLIRDGKMAQRMMIYMMLGSVIVLALGFQEWLDKRTLDSIEKARLLGPQLQPNDFGAFVAYTACPFLALLLTHLRSPRAWVVTIPYLAAMARVLVASFSRGAYLGFALAGVVAGYVRGKAFLLGAGVLGIALVAAMPQLLPESVASRMSQTQSDDGETIDASAQTRLILWKAALNMTVESPAFGWGFKSFPEFKDKYTEVEVHESDNHNMYLYLSSQMGIPAVVLFALILWRMYTLGARVYRAASEGLVRVIGMSAASMAAATFVINMFGSRMVDMSVSVYFWVTLAVVGRLWAEQREHQQEEEAS